MNVCNVKPSTGNLKKMIKLCKCYRDVDPTMPNIKLILL